ncbi:MAG: phosphoribosylformylglycinamidine synthase subunit PurS [Cyanobacteria bacterium]|jgi:phosphoribosylformylglycinamidine synthase|uniref:phosphoribosylformylglycinamidine synthase subunit PurS n=1 Tax=Geminocystis sp. TaxID=2664100 RepID=UPI001D6C8E3B|nr:phosphoribosylformylglycinamidine synthase subunit PurS [Cyanobacteria bacterium CG_2015-16_32_12]NCQ05531.1 phosphoribosylformylglycinamidine synthase subunit PurS [Cyanobacteria bacterium CG_2015-09_32_10]NCS83973.1 phosphoribosylformylglycinamidine synthase subunit PurS [Cyanobacteria bacterium CG_2015-02_32_10]
MTQKFNSRVYVTLRPSVLDTAGTAVESGLHQLGYGTVENVRIGKFIELIIVAENQESADKQLHQMCDQLLANPVIENYSFDLIPID